MGDFLILLIILIVSCCGYIYYRIVSVDCKTDLFGNDIPQGDVIYDKQKQYGYELISSEETEKIKPNEFVLKSQYFDASRLSKSNSSIVTNKFIYRPKTFKEYIGQEKSKQLLEAFIYGCKETNNVMPHILIDGLAGFGKTSASYIIANSFKDSKVIFRIASELTDMEQLQKLFEEIQTSKADRVFLILDEIHNFKVKYAELLYTALEDFKIGDVEIKPFTMIGCTTEKGKLLRKLKPFVDRCKIQITLEDYTENEIIEILEQYNKQCFKNKIANNIINSISKIAKGIPRYAIRLFESYAYLQDFDLLCEVNSIRDKENGLTENDYKILGYLNRNGIIGVDTLSAYMDISKENYTYQYENFLIKKEYIVKLRTGRRITNKGKEVLK